MKVIKIQIENYKSLRGKHEFNPNGASFMLVGPNGAGKTSAGRALMDLLTKKFPSRPITEGKTAGGLEFELEDGRTLVARFTEGKEPKLEVLSSDGLPMNTTKELLVELAGAGMHFDIDKFLALQPKPRRELLEKIAGLDLRDLNEAEKTASDARREKGAELKAAKARVKPFDEKLAAMPEVDTAEASQKLEEMTAHNAQVVRVQDGLKTRRDKIAELQEQIDKYTLEVEKGEEWLKNTPVHEDEELDKIRTQIQSSDKIREAKQLAKEASIATKLDTQHKELDDKIKEIREKKMAAIRSVKLPAEGLAFSEDGDDLLLDGLPFEDEQIAASRKLIAAIQIAESMRGEIPYLHFDGACLDRKSAEHLFAWAEERGLQLCLERPLWDGGEGVKMELIEQAEGPVPQPEKKAPVKTTATKADKPVAEAATSPGPAKNETISNTNKNTMPWD